MLLSIACLYRVPLLPQLNLLSNGQLQLALQNFFSSAFFIRAATSLRLSSFSPVATTVVACDDTTSFTLASTPLAKSSLTPPTIWLTPAALREMGFP